MLRDRIIGVFRLDPLTFESIEHDPQATGQAAAIVGVIALISAAGAVIVALSTAASVANTFFSSLLWTFAGWLIWSYSSYIIGTTFFRGQATPQEMLRVIGFAFAPQALAIIPCVGGLIGAIWSLAAVFVAIRQGLDLDVWRAFWTAVAGFLIYLLGGALINLLLGNYAMLANPVVP
jgi:hypothetical protein